MPHQTLKLQGGVIVNETPVINATGIASSNRIRFKPDPQGLSLPEKLGGWARFYATQITVGVVRALWGWQDTADNQWLAWGADISTFGSTEPVLAAVQCTVSGSTGLTSATGTVKNLTPSIQTSMGPLNFVTIAGSNIVQSFDGTSVQPNVTSAYFSNPIAVGGIVLQGMYQIVPGSYINGTGYSIYAVDVLGNPANAAYSTTNGPITGVTFTPGTPNTLTISGLSTAIPPGEALNIIVADGSISGTYMVLTSTATTAVVATTLSSYTFSTTGFWNNNGTVPQFYTTSASSTVEYFLPDHGLTPGDPLYVLNPTLVGGLMIQGEYTVFEVLNKSQVTFIAATAATATSQQYQGAIPVSSGSLSAGRITLNYSAIYTMFHAITTAGGIYVQGINPVDWNGNLTLFIQSGNSVILTNGSATGSYISGGSFTNIGGNQVTVLASTYPLGTVGNAIEAGFWTLDSWGNDLIAVSADTVAVAYPTQPLYYQPIYYWDATSGVTAQPIFAGPPANNGAFVAMPERQIVAWGSTFSGILDPLLVRWCDINNFNTWAAQITNQAGSFRLASGTTIIGGRQLPQQGLLWTDIELWAVQYINQPYVYGFNKIGQGCGLIGKYAHGVLGGIVYWMSKTQIWMLSVDGVVPIPCPVWDVAFQELDLVNADKIVCATNAMFQEIAWHFPVKGGTGENSAYIKVNVAGLPAGQPPIWDFGTLDRSAWLDVSVLQQPLGFSPANKYVYQHEISPDADGAAMGETFTTGWFAVAEGDVMPYVDQFWPDMKWGYYGQTQNAQVIMSFAAQAYPGAAQYSYGPYTVGQSTSYISPRIRNRLINFTVSGTGTGTWWRLGGIRYRVQSDGKY